MICKTPQTLRLTAGFEEMFLSLDGQYGAAQARSFQTTLQTQVKTMKEHRANRESHCRYAGRAAKISLRTDTPYPMTPTTHCTHCWYAGRVAKYGFGPPPHTQ